MLKKHKFYKKIKHFYSKKHKIILTIRCYGIRQGNALDS